MKSSINKSTNEAPLNPLFDASTQTLLWPQPALEGVFLGRRKRFFADFLLPNTKEVQVAHLANTGSLKDVIQTDLLSTDARGGTKGQPCLILPSDDPSRKLQWSLVAIGCKPSESDLEWVGVHTPVPNMLVAELIKAKLLLPDLRSYKTEHQLNSQTRLDGLATTESGDEIFIEIKNVTLARLTYPKNLHSPHPSSSSIESNSTKSNSIESNSTESNSTGEPVWMAEFPDSVTKRGQKHLVEMMDILRAGKRSLMIFVVQRGDCSGFRPAADLDPTYSKLFADYLKCGGEALALSCRVSPRGVQFLKVLPLSTSGEISE